MTRTPDAIFVALSTFAQHDAAPLEALRRSGVPFRLHAGGTRITAAELASDAADATVVIAGVEPYDRSVLDTLPVLRCISRCGAGTDSVDLAEARARGIAVVNTPEAPGRAVAELALAAMLSLVRNLPRQTALMRERKWVRVEAHLLAGRRVGIVGLGRIGRRVARLLRAFDADVIAADPLADEAWARANGVTLVPLPELLRTADIVTLHAARNAGSPLVIDAAALATMRRGALIVNLARGGMIDELALVDGLRSGAIGGAALDVYVDEPYRGPLCDQENVILTPHSATLTVETRVAMETECIDKALRFLRGELKSDERIV